MADDAAEEAYAAAVEEIARVVTSKERELSFNDKRFRALDRMPSELFQFMKLGKEYRNDTRKEKNKLRSVKDKMIIPYIVESKYSDIFQDKMRKSINLRNFVDRYTNNMSDSEFLIENIRSINISNTNISDISFINDSFDIVSFSAESAPISDINPLIKCENIHDIDLSNTNVKDFSPISHLKKIRIAILRNINFSDFSFIRNLKSCYLLDLRNTNFKNLNNLDNNSRLEVLLLDNSLISDLSDIGKLNELAIIQLSETKILDLRPLTSLGELGNLAAPGLTFKNTPATARDGRLAELSKIENDEERTRKTLEYLRSLPPWPEPYTPAYTPDGSPPQPIGEPPEAPDADAQPRLVLTNDDRIDIAPILPGEAELDDPIRRRLYKRLPRAVDDLLKAVNRYPEIDRPVRSLRQLSEAAFEDADFLMIHLDINALTDLRQSQSNRPDDEKLDPDCLAALDAVLSIGPGITMGHPDIEALEKRLREYERSRVGEGVAEHERKIVGALGDSALATERTQHVARMTASAGTTGRVAETRRGFTKNTILLMVLIAERSLDAVVGHVLGGQTIAAAQFLVAQSQAILAIAPTWGHSALAWAEYVLLQAQKIIDDAKRRD